jgi:hypothetical protein
MNRTYNQQAQAMPSDLVEMGKLGAIVGLCGAGAQNLKRIGREEIEPAAALADTLRVGVASGLATAAAALVAGAFRPSPLLSLVATLATGTAVMYALTQDSTATPNGDDDA